MQATTVTTITAQSHEDKETKHKTQQVISYKILIDTRTLLGSHVHPKYNLLFILMQLFPNFIVLLHVLIFLKCKFKLN